MSEQIERRLGQGWTLFGFDRQTNRPMVLIDTATDDWKPLAGGSPKGNNVLVKVKLVTEKQALRLLEDGDRTEVTRLTAIQVRDGELVRYLSPPHELSRDERRQIAHGTYPFVTGKMPCPVTTELILPVSAGLWIEITQVRRPKADRWAIDYTVWDFRPNFLRHSPPGGSRRSLPEKPKDRSEERARRARSRRRDPAPPPKQTDIDYAKRDGTYTHAGAHAMPDEPSAVDPDWLDKHSDKLKANEDERLAEERQVQRGKSASKRLREANLRAVKRGADPTPHIDRIEHELSELERLGEEAA